jgi:hypothetical protein
MLIHIKIIIALNKTKLLTLNRLHKVKEKNKHTELQISSCENRVIIIFLIYDFKTYLVYLSWTACMSTCYRSGFLCCSNWWTCFASTSGWTFCCKSGWCSRCWSCIWARWIRLEVIKHQKIKIQCYWFYLGCRLAWTITTWFRLE